MSVRIISLRSQSTDGAPIVVDRLDWESAKIAVVICDMWNTTQCVSAARRVVDMAPRVNEVAARLREDGALIVHAPGGCMEYHAGTPAREPGEPCTMGGPPYPWTHQIESIEIAPADAVTDDGNELFALLEGRGIQDVVIMGVHANRCVLGRPYGIRQSVYWGKQPVLCRDLTDSCHRDPRGHLWGNEQMISHIERYWCPSLTSNQLVGGAEFHFRSI